MTIYAEESKAVTNATPVQLTPSKFNVPGGVKAGRAVIVVKSAPIFYGFLTAPTSLNGYKGDTDEVITINGYENIKNFRAVAQSTAATLYVNYFN
jgi:hypothetical protein